jgi:environmental stress-induced protein Ves
MTVRLREGKPELQIITLSSATEQQWVNLAGSTRELWLETDDTTGAVILRISVATLAAPAAFSPLPGMNRSFLPLDEIAVELAIDGKHLLARKHEVVQFRGDADTRMVALSRPGRALNIMSDGRAAYHTLELKDSGTLDCHSVIALDDWHGSLKLRSGDLIIAAGAPVQIGGKSAVVQLTAKNGM